jgi:hypothetical protein
MKNESLRHALSARLLSNLQALSSCQQLTVSRKKAETTKQVEIYRFGASLEVPKPISGYHTSPDGLVLRYPGSASLTRLHLISLPVKAWFNVCPRTQLSPGPTESRLAHENPYES